jgi:competence protein ComEA
LKRWLVTLVWLLLCASKATFALEINQANQAELDSLKGMGPSLSAKVLKARTEAPFKSWADLMQRVSGVGRAKAKEFSDQGLTVNGHPLKP